MTEPPDPGKLPPDKPSKPPGSPAGRPNFPPGTKSSIKLPVSYGATLGDPGPDQASDGSTTNDSKVRTEQPTAPIGCAPAGFPPGTAPSSHGSSRVGSRRSSRSWSDRVDDPDSDPDTLPALPFGSSARGVLGPAGGAPGLASSRYDAGAMGSPPSVGKSLAAAINEDLAATSSSIGLNP